MYYWMIYNTTTGALGKHESTHPPTVEKTATAADGTETTTSVFDTNLLPGSGFALVGFYDDVNNPMPSDFKSAFDSPGEYLYQNNAFVSNPNYETNAFAQAQQQQLSVLSSGLKATLTGGFTAKTLVGSATTPHKYPTDQDAQSNFGAAVDAFTTNPNKTAVTLETLDAGWVSHTKTEFYGIFTDGDNWKEAQYPQLSMLQAKVNGMKLSDYATLADAISAVQAITWTAATY